MVLPRPLAGGQSLGGLDLRARSFEIRLLVTHATQASLQCGSGKFHPRTWTLYGSRKRLNHSCWGRYSEGLERRETRRPSNDRIMGRPGVVASDVISPSGGMAEGGAGSAWSSS